MRALAVIVRSVCVIGVLLVGATVADAALIEVRHRDQAPPLVVVTGDFEPSDIDTFRKIVAPLKKATVSLESDGGALVAGIRIGTLIRTKKFVTLVPDGALCASACAIAWLGGVKRFVGKDAGVGFHAAYVIKAGTAAESGPGNAILGAYLNQLGLSEKAIRYVTYADPTTIHWMTVEEAAEHEITVASVGAKPVVASKATVANAGRDYPDGSPERRALDFVQSLAARWSGPIGIKDEDDALAPLYTDVVLYHGKPLAREALVTRKRRLAERWSERSYAVRAPSLSATCTGAGGVCQVKGVMEWEFRNTRSKETARGITSFDYSLVFDGDTPHIAAESSAVTEKPHAAPNSLKQVGKNLQQFLAKLSSKLAPSPRKQSPARPAGTAAR